MTSRPPKKKKYKEEEKTTEESVFLSEKNSEYNTLIPMLNAEYVRVRHPFLKKDFHLKTNSEEFLNLFYEFTQKGLGDKMEKELAYFAKNYDSKWLPVLNNAKLYCENKNALLPQANQSA